MTFDEPRHVPGNHFVSQGVVSSMARAMGGAWKQQLGSWAREAPQKVLFRAWTRSLEDGRGDRDTCVEDARRNGKRGRLTGATPIPTKRRDSQKLILFENGERTP